MSLELNTFLICRCCACSEQKQSDFIDIFKEQRFGERIVEILLKYLPFQINEVDTESHFICRKCWTTFEHFHSFIEYIRSCQIQMVHIKCEITDEFSIEHVKPELSIAGSVKSDFDNNNDDDIDDFSGNNDIDSLAPELKYDINIINDKQTTELDCITKTLSKPLENSQLNRKSNKNISIKFGGKIKTDLKKQNRQEQRKIDNQNIQDFFKLQCQECNLVDTFNTFDLLRLHYLQAHNNKRGYISCCSKKLVRHCELIEHIEWHTNPDKFKCKICDKLYTDQQALKIHQLLHSTSENEKIFICDICGKSYPIRHHFLQHFRSVHFIEKKFKCPECGKSFVQNSILRKHIRNIHQNANIHMCDICAKIYRSKYNCKLHRLHEHGPESLRPARLECDKCGKLLKNKQSLKMHIARSHEGKSQSCQLCGNIYSNVQALKKHIKFMHTDKPIHKCTLCDKAFKRKVTLKEHMASHTGEVNLYTCLYCPKTFNSGANMHRHRKNGHPDEWLRDKQMNHSRKLNLVNIVSK